MTGKQRNILTHIWFLPEGTAFTSPSNGNISRTSWCDSAEPTLGNFKLVQAKSVTKAAPGGTRVEEREIGIRSVELYDAYYVGNVAKWTVDVTRVYALLWGLLHGAPDALNAASTTFTPNTGRCAVRGMLIVQHYDQDSEDGSTPIATANVYALLTIQGDVTMDPLSAEATKIQITLEQLSSPNNEGDITTPA